MLSILSIWHGTTGTAGRPRRRVCVHSAASRVPMHHPRTGGCGTRRPRGQGQPMAGTATANELRATVVPSPSWPWSFSPAAPYHPDPAP